MSLNTAPCLFLNMTIKNLFIITLLIIVFSSINACKTKKATQIHLVSNQLKVKSACIQEEIPGTKGEKEKSYLQIDFDELSEAYSIDSIQVISSKSQTIKELRFISGGNRFRNEIIKPKLRVSDDGPSLPTAILYFTKDNQNYLQYVNTIKMEEPIYLP